MVKLDKPNRSAEIAFQRSDLAIFDEVISVWIRASEEPSAASATTLLRQLQPWPPPLPAAPNLPLPLEPCCPLRRFPPARALLAAASRSACPVARILPAFDAGPHGCPSYYPLLAL